MRCSGIISVLVLLLGLHSPSASDQCNDGSHQSTSWRVATSTTRSGWAWDVMQLNFVDADGIVVALGDDCVAIHSGSVSDRTRGGIPGYEPENAFNTNRAIWGGRKTAGEFFLGFRCTRSRSVQTVQIIQYGSKHVTDNLSVQRLHGREWITVHRTKLQEVDAMETIPIACITETEPSSPRTSLPASGVHTTGNNHNSEVGCDQKRDYSSKSWRVLALTTRSGWAWDVMHLNFFTANGNMVELSSSCRPIQSGSVSDAEDGIAGYESRNAFRSNGNWWGGRKNSSSEFYLGFTCTESQVVRSVEILQGASFRS